MSFWTGLEALSGHRPGAFTGMTMKSLFDKDMWKRRPREFPSPRYAEEGLPPPTTAWYGGQAPTPAMAPVRDRPFPTPRRGTVTIGDRVRTTPLQQQRIDTGIDQIQRETQGLRTPPNIYGDARVAPNPYARPNLLNIFSPLPVMRGDQMGSQQTSNGGSRFGDWWRKLSPALQADDIATEAEVEAMNDSRSQMLTDLLAETSIEDEPRIVSRYKKKKKRSPKTWRSKSRGYRLKRV